MFDPAVTGVLNDQGEAAQAPATRAWATTSWVAGSAKLAINGGTRIWGPWVDGYQVLEATLTTYETRQLTLTPGTAAAGETAKIALAAKENGNRRFHTEAYDAVVESDGCLTSLRVEGVELLRPGVDVSRGLYFHDGKSALKLPTLAEPARNVLTAKSTQAELHYEFGPDTITCTATNASEGLLALFIVLDPAVVAMQDGAGHWSKVPVAGVPGGPIEKQWETTTWFAPGTRLKVTGGSRLWGPWTMQKLQVWEASLAPKETRKVVLQMGEPTTEEAGKVASVTGLKTIRRDLTVLAPLEYEVFQRRTRLEGAVRLRGRVRPTCDRLEVRLTGKALDGPLPDRWEEVPLKDGQRFERALPAKAGGWYKVELRALKGAAVMAEAAIEHVGVGEVFLGAGQSNSTNCGEARIQQTSGMVSSFSGQHWQIADDPQPGVHDGSSGGSYWPAFGDALVARYHVPIGVASCGHSGTSVSQWSPGGELFRWLADREDQLGPHGFRAVLWHQGESDVGMSVEEYHQRLATLIAASKQSAGWDFPWFVAQVSYHNPQNPTFSNPRAAQKKLWDEGAALAGPDTDTLTGDNRDAGGQGIHFSPKGLRAHGQLWAEKVGVWLDKVLTPN